MTAAAQPDRDRIKNKLHDLNTRVQADPTHKLEVIKKFYAEQSAADAEAADMALIVKDIVEAGDVPVNQTTHLKVATPILICGMFLGALLSLAAVVVGGYAIYKPQASLLTEMHLFGNSISTQSVAVALVFVGLVCLVMIVRKAFSIAQFRG